MCSGDKIKDKELELHTEAGMELDVDGSEETFLPAGKTPGTEINDQPFFYCSADSIKRGLPAISVMPNTFPVLEIYIFIYIDIYLYRYIDISI